MNDTRRILYRVEPEVTVELIGLLLKNADGERGVRELLRVPRMRQPVASCERQLASLGLTVDGQRTAAQLTKHRREIQAKLDRGYYVEGKISEAFWHENLKRGSRSWPRSRPS